MQPSKFVILLLERKIQTRGILGSQNRVDFAKFYQYLTVVIIYINTMKTTFYLNLAILPFFKTAETQKHVNKINNFLLFTCKLWKLEKCLLGIKALYSETHNNEYIERVHQMSYSSLRDNGMLQIFSFLIKWLYGTI